MGRFKKELTALSNEEYKQILKVLELYEAEHVRIDEVHNVYIISPEGMSKLLKMKNNFGRRLKKLSIPTPRKDPYYYVAKFINPREIAITYHFTTVKKYIYVKDKESIKRNMPAKWSIWENKQKLLVKKALKENSDPKFHIKVKEELRYKLEKAKEEYDYLYEHIDDENLQALWSTYEIAKEYPAINYKMDKKSYQNSYLRKYVPNILQYEEKTRYVRLDNEVEEFIKNSTNAFAFFYYKVDKE